MNPAGGESLSRTRQGAESMKIAVLIKQIPTPSEMRFDSTERRMVRDGVALEPNSLDMVALGAALALRAAVGGQVLAISMGPPSAKDVLKAALMGGADEAWLISDRTLAGSDTLATAHALADAVRLQEADLVLAGRHSLDAETGQVGPMVAELLGWSLVTAATRLALDGAGRLRIERSLEGAKETIVCPLPAVITACEELAEEVYISRKKVAAAEELPIGHLDASQLGGDRSRYGAEGSPTRVLALRQEQLDRAGRMVDPHDVAAVETTLEDCLAKAPRRRPEDVRRGLGGQLWVALPRLDESGQQFGRELLGDAYRLTRPADGLVAAVVWGSLTAAQRAMLAQAGASIVYEMQAADGEAFHSAQAAASLAEAIREKQPAAVLFPSTTYGREWAGRLAARLEIGLTGDAVAFRLAEEGGLVMDKPSFGGLMVAPIISRTRPDLATIRPGVCQPLDTPRLGTVEVVQLALPEARDGMEVGGTVPFAVEAGLLEPRPVVLSVGMGVPEDGVAMVAEMATRHGFGLAASRAVTDAGRLPKAFQVGLTGRTIAPRVYVALGISGAFEHLVGIRRADVVVAVNSDAEAPIFQAADLGMVADWQEGLKALVGVLSRAQD